MGANPVGMLAPMSIEFPRNKYFVLRHLTFKSRNKYFPTDQKTSSILEPTIEVLLVSPLTSYYQLLTICFISFDGAEIKNTTTTTISRFVVSHVSLFCHHCRDGRGAEAEHNPDVFFGFGAGSRFEFLN